jgi:hypothetical protein
MAHPALSLPCLTSRQDENSIFSFSSLLFKRLSIDKRLERYQFSGLLLSVSDQYLAFDDAYHRLVLYSQKVRLMVQPL